MIIAADIGNTNIKIGLFDKDRLVKSWRISTDVHRTSDEHGSILKQLFFAAGIDADSITGRDYQQRYSPTELYHHAHDGILSRRHSHSGGRGHKNGA